MKEKRATLMDVAREAGVSKQTVSRVINNSESVADETRARVQQAVDRLGFRPSTLARNLTSGRSFTVGIVAPGLFFLGTELYLGIARTVDALGYTVVMKHLSQFNAGAVREVVHDLLDMQVDGILWAIPDRAATREWLKDGLIEEIPVPLVFVSSKKRPNTHVVSFDNYAGARMATQHLIDTGRKRIAHITGPADWWTARERVRGWRSALQEAGLRADDDLLVEGTWRASAGEAAFAELLERGLKIDGLFAGNDKMALGALLVAHRRGLRVPEDLAVVGFDNVPESASYFPPLTTVLQDKELLGESAVRKLIALVETRFNTQRRVERINVPLTQSLIVRDSAPSVLMEPAKAQPARSRRAAELRLEGGA